MHDRHNGQRLGEGEGNFQCNQSSRPPDTHTQAFITGLHLCGVCVCE